MYESPTIIEVMKPKATEIPLTHATRRLPTPEQGLKLGRYFGNEPEDWMRLQNHHLFRKTERDLWPTNSALSFQSKRKGYPLGIEGTTSRIETPRPHPRGRGWGRGGESGIRTHGRG